MNKYLFSDVFFTEYWSTGSPNLCPQSLLMIYHHDVELEMGHNKAGNPVVLT